MTIAKFIEQSNNADSSETLFLFYSQAMSSIGFDRIIFSLMTNHLAINKVAHRGLMQNYPDDWMSYYEGENFESIDPVRRNIYSSANIFACKDLFDSNHLTKKQLEMLKEAESAGFYNGVGIPLRSSRGAIAGIGASSSSKDLKISNQYSLSMANLLSQQFYSSFLNLKKQKLSSSNENLLEVSLTDREQEVLQWCGRGKTKWEVGRILSISEHTVGYHIKNSMKKLDANNTSSVLVRALARGFIQI